jgi:YbbR domain-containing protein
MRDFLTKDISWKIFSLGLAIALYFTVRAVRQSGGDTGRPLDARATYTYWGVPVLVMSSASDVREFKVNPAIVQVTVRGRPETLSQLQEEDIRVTVDLTGIESTKGLTKRVHVATPPGITLVEVVPQEVNVVIPPKKDQTQ